MTNGKVAAQDNNPIIPHEFQAACSERTANRRPKLLFLAHAFPPVRAIGCVRTWNTAKYLARLGWEITVVTPEPSVLRYVEDTQKVEQLEQEGIRRILTGHRWRWLSPDHLSCWNQGLGWIVGGACRRAARYLGVDDDIGWIRPVKQACSILTADDVDVILATGSPFLAFTLAKWLSDRLDRPYVLDYRDPWTENPHDDTRAPRATVQKEAMLLAGCAAATIVSQSWASVMETRFHVGPKLHVIPNGYDSEELANVEPYNFGHPAIVYTGIFYPPKRVITPVMAALKLLKENASGRNNRWYFHYYGVCDAHVREEADRFDVVDRVVLHGRVPRKEALSAVRGANVAVVIASVLTEETQADNGIVTGKLFEPLGLGTPILLIAPHGSDATQIVEETGMGRAFDGTDIEGIVQFLSSIAQTEPNKRSACADRYSWPVLATKLDSILRGVIAPRQGDMLTKTKSSIGHKKQVLS
jgi:glycosyltransferase involved in cell wall biosynthesis